MHYHATTTATSKNAGSYRNDSVTRIERRFNARILSSLHKWIAYPRLTPGRGCWSQRMLMCVQAITGRCQLAYVMLPGAAPRGCPSRHPSMGSRPSA